MKYILILIATILVSCEDEASKYVRPTPTVKGSEAELDTLSPLYHTAVLKHAINVITHYHKK